MLNPRRTAIALLLAASALAVPAGVLGAQASKEEGTSAATKYKVRYSFQRDAQAARAAGQQLPTFHIAGPSRYALSGLRAVSSAPLAAGRGYTKKELAEIRAAQLRLVRNMTAGPIANPGGTLVISHPTLGRIVLSNTGALPPVPTIPSGRISLPNPGMLAGPSAVASASERGGDLGTSKGDPDSGGGEPGDFPVLEPGSGFAGPTAQPPAVGNPSLRGYDAKAIARWDVVPYQDFDGLFNIGVVAFHMNGIDRVEFSVDGGAWTPVTEMKLNPRTDVVEYTATLDASKFEDGLVEVRARVFPEGAGEVRVLGGPVQYTGDESGWYGPELDKDGKPTNSLWIGEHSLELFANGGGSLAEQVIELDAGEYTWGEPPLANPISASARGQGLTQRDAARWVIVRAKPGVAPEQVVISDSVHTSPWRDAEGQAWSIKYSKVKLQGLTLRTSPVYLLNSILWLDDCTVVGEGQYVPGGGFTVGHGFFTNTHFSDLQYATGYHGSRGSGNFVRGCLFERIGEKAIRAGYLVLNTTIDRVEHAPGSGWHSSAIANPLPHDNRIYYDLRLTNIADRALAFRSDVWNLNGHRDVVMSSLIVTGDPGVGYLMMLGGTIENMLILNTTFVAPTVERTVSYRTGLPRSDPQYFNPILLYYDNFTLNGEQATPPSGE